MKIGIDIGGSHIATGIILEKGRLLAKESRDISVAKLNSEKRAKEIIIETIKNEIKILIDAYDYNISDISKIGISVPGAPSDGCIKNLVNLNIKNFNIAEELSKIYKTKINVTNDGKCAGIAEKKYGSLQKYGDAVFLCIGTGVGSAVFINNDLLVPKRNPGFEFGHMIIQKDGIECNCGNKGCFETYASMKRFKKSAIRELKLLEDFQSEEVQHYIRENIDKENVKKFVENYIDNIAIGVSNIINIFEPEAICFGGSFSYYEDIFLPLLKQKLKEYVFNKNQNIDLVPAKLRNDAGIIGAAQI